MKRIIIVLSFLSLVSCKKGTLLPDGSLNDSYDNQLTGMSAIDMLTSSDFTSMGIEIDYMPGYKPDTAVITNVINFLDSICNKPGGITVQEKQIDASGKQMNVNEVMNLEVTNRRYFNNGANLWLCVTITDAPFATNSSYLSIAYRNTSICLFGKTIYNISGGTGQPSRTTVETAALEIELCHLMGLVNTAPKLAPIHANHLDPVHDHHCTNPNCLMYYKGETTDITGWINGDAIPVLDDDCKLDLTTNGGK